jgi:folate-binding protein YgfZ
MDGYASVASAQENVDLVADYQAITDGVGLVDLSARTQIELTGDDRASFLHNLCTSEIKKLPTGSGAELFLTDARGHILAHGFAFAGPSSLVLETVEGVGPQLIQHLDRYQIREKVKFIDRSNDWAELLVAGAKAPEFLLGLGIANVPEARLAHIETQLFDQPISLRRVEFTNSPGFMVSCPRADQNMIREKLIAAGARACREAAFEAARIEAGLPVYGRDISDKNLPQEVARDERTISFTKGCYIGQETVARIDALGHVNRTLVGLRFASQQVPEAGLELSASGQVVGQVTSAAFSPRFHAAIALAYVRRGSNTPGFKLTSALGDAEIVKLPMA